MAASQAALPTSGEKEPAAQGRHSSWPLSGWYHSVDCDYLYMAQVR